MSPRRSADVARRGVVEDRISSLPIELLLQILLRLRCARAAARTGLVSRHWRGLWALLPEIHLRDLPDSVKASLIKLSRPGVVEAPPDVLHVETSGKGITNKLVVSCLRHAALLAPKELKLTLTVPQIRPTTCIELPCFDRTESIELTQCGINFELKPPQAGNFDKLKRLALTGGYFNATEMLPRCPSLRRLEVVRTYNRGSSQTIDSATLLELVLDTTNVKVIAPNLEKLSLGCTLHLEKTKLEDVAKLRELTLLGLQLDRLGRLVCFGLGAEDLWNKLPHLHLLRFKLTLGQLHYEFDPRFLMRTLPKTSILMLQLSTSGHEFAGTVLRVLKMVEGIEELTILMELSELQETCSPECYCRPSRTWTSEDLSLLHLKKVELKDFTGANSATSVLELLLASARALEKMNVTLCNKDSPGYEGHKQQLINIFNQYPTVECEVLDA
ncbi:hypothetical protein ACP70R_043010 [Stipagrostis hirtigluma subsp. patula]